MGADEDELDQDDGSKVEDPASVVVEEEKFGVIEDLPFLN